MQTDEIDSGGKPPELERRYPDPTINRQFWLADALIRIRSYPWGAVDQVATRLTDGDVAAFCRVVAALNEDNPTT